MKEKIICGLPEIDFHALATYNAERGRGLIHTRKWEKEMEILQERFNKYMDEAKKEKSV
jgi:hypothetical protein